MKTCVTDVCVYDWLNSLKEPVRKADCIQLVGLMKQVCDCEPRMWGNSIVGFGHYHYKYNSGHAGSWFLTGFASRKNNLVVYIMDGVNEYSDLLEKLDKEEKKIKSGVSCLYLGLLSRLDMELLEQVIRMSVDNMQTIYPENHC